MSAGDFLIYRNNADSSSVVPNSGSPLDATWDTEEKDEGSAATYSAGTFTFTNTAPYLILYSEKFYTSNTANNTRVSVQGRLRINAADVIEGASSGYIRKSSGQQTCICAGFAIYNATANDTLVTRFYRDDNSTSSTPNRVAGFGGVQIFQLDAADDFAHYSTTSTNSMTSTEANVSNWSTDTEETGFSRSTDTVTISTAGRYLMLFSGATIQTGTARLGATVFLERGTTEVTGIRGYSHMRGSEDNKDGALSFAGIVDVSASDTFTLRMDADSGTLTLSSGAVWSWWQLPSGNETAIAEATTGDMNASGADFEWDTLPYIDTGGFTGTAGNTNIDVDQNCHLLAFWNQGKKVVDSTQRAYPQGRVSNSGTIIDYACSGNYHRNSSSIGTFMAHSGASIMLDVANGNSITLYNDAIGASGTVDCDSGHFSLLNLEGLYKSYSYTIPMTITDVDGDELIANTQTNVIISGASFLSPQSTGKVELVQNSNYTGTIINQTSIDSWADDSIQFDVSAGALADTHCYLFVTNSAAQQEYIAVTVGVPPETYAESIENLTPSPSHIWTFQNTYADEIGTATANGGASGGTITFETSPILCKGDSHSMLINETGEFCSPSDQTDMNSSSQSRRYFGGWFRLNNISQGLSVIYEEGAQVNNIAFLNGFGNNAMVQIANANDDYVQLYLDKPLTPNRTYFIMWKFVASGQDSGVCVLWLDGVEQALSDGNPWETPQLDSHTGNITWGHEGTESLKVGDDRGTDATTIAFVSPTDCYYSHWMNWSASTITPTQVRVNLFEKGAVADYTISSDTEANMQTAFDAYEETLYTDSPCVFEIEECTDGDFTLVLNDITFEDRVSIQFRYLGTDELTLRLENGSVIDTDKLSKPYGGTFATETPASFTVSGLLSGSLVAIFDDETADDGSMNTQLAITASSGSTFPYSHSGATNDIKVQVLKDGYEEVVIPFTLGASDQILNITQEIETNG